MITLNNSRLWAFDVDDTLIRWSGLTYTPIPAHIELVKKAKILGHAVIVWSNGGPEWAERIVRELGLEDSVDLCCGKPSWYVDDETIDKTIPLERRVWKL